MTEEIAIIIPAYKETFLRATLESLAAQTDRRFHVYVGDDASPYPLEPVIKEFEDKIPLTYRRFDSNLGGKDLVGQWERCISMSKRERYIWLFSDDDLISPDCVASYLSLPADIRDDALIHFDIDVIDAQGKVVAIPTPYPVRLTAEEFLHKKLRGEIISYVVEFIFPRSLYEASGGFERFDLAWGSDFMTWLKMAAVAGKGILTLKGPKVSWRRSEENISPRMDRPTLVRKMESLIGNARFIRRMIKNDPGHFPNSQSVFRWTRFPLGEIYRKRKYLGIKQSLRLAVRYGIAMLSGSDNTKR